MALSAVAGIIGRHGRFDRCVVGPAAAMGEHVGPGERAVIVPGLFVQEPLAVGSREVVDVIQAAATQCMIVLACEATRR